LRGLPAASLKRGIAVAARRGIDWPPAFGVRARRKAKQAVIHRIHSEVGNTVVGPDDSQRAHAQEQVTPAPPGHFLSDELECDCARFLEDVRTLVSRREQDLARAGARL
jgi:hypothetical protein